MPSKKTILQSRATEETRSLTIKIPLALAEDIQRFRDELTRQAPNLVFNASAVCTEALRQALRQARKELAAGAPPASAPPAVTATPPPQGERFVVENPP